MNIAIIGIGSIGSYVSAMLAHNTDHHLHLLARSNYQIISDEGISVEIASNKYCFKTHRFTVYDNINNMPKCDLVFLAVRESHLGNLLPDLERICLDHTTIVCLQNGINFEKQVQDALPSQPLYSGTCWIKVTKLAQGVIRHEFGNTLKLGRAGQGSEELKCNTGQNSDQALKQLFSEANLECQFVDNIQSVQLTKLALNVPFFILMAHEGKSVPEILSDNVLNILREELQQEIINACKMYGSPADEIFLKDTLTSLRQNAAKAPDSSKISTQTIKSELPGNAGALLDLFESNNIQLPKLRSFYDILSRSLG